MQDTVNVGEERMVFEILTVELFAWSKGGDTFTAVEISTEDFSLPLGYIVLSIPVDNCLGRHLSIIVFRFTGLERGVLIFDHVHLQVRCHVVQKDALTCLIEVYHGRDCDQFRRVETLIDSVRAEVTEGAISGNFDGAE